MKAVCPRCSRRVSHHDGRWIRHGMTPGTDDWCAMSRQMVTAAGHSPDDYYRRATHVCDLATQVQDRDTTVVWEVLTATPADEVQRLLMIALAAIDVDAPMDRLFGWVYQLPAARCAS